MRRTSEALALLGAGAWLHAAEGERDLGAWREFLRRPWEKPEQPLAAVAGSHPRLFLTRARLAGLKRRAQGTHAGIWAMIREKADGYRGKLPPANFTKQQDMREAGRGVPWQALAYLVGGDPADLATARRWILTVCDFPHWEKDNSLAGGECLFGVAVGYDWLYSEFSDDERARIRTKLVRQARAMRDGPPVHFDVWLANHNHVEHTGLAAAGFALFDEVPEAIDWVRQADLVYREFLHQASADGSSTEGHQYWAYTTESALRYFELARDLLGTNYYDHPWLKRAGQFIIHSTLPDFNAKGCVMTFGDAGRTFASHGPTHLLYRVAAEYRDPHAQWLALEMDRRHVGRGDFCTWANLLWYDDTLAPKPLAALPTFGNSEDIGWVTDRSSWSEDAVMVAFKCGPMHGHKTQAFYERQFREKWPRFKSIGGGHGQPDVNSFQIYAHGKWLAIDPGYETPKHTRTHNTLLVGGRGQLGEGTTWFDRDTVLARGAASAILKADTRPTHDYIVGDARNIYPAESGLARFHRHFVYLKPDLVVIVDDLASRQATEVAWLLHTEVEWRGAGPGICVARNGDVEMDVQVLLPASAAPAIKGRTLTLAVPVDGRSRIVTVLHPRKQGRPAAQARLRSHQGDRLVIEIEAGRTLRLDLDLAAQQVVVA